MPSSRQYAAGDDEPGPASRTWIIPGTRRSGDDVTNADSTYLATWYNFIDDIEPAIESFDVSVASSRLHPAYNGESVQKLFKLFRFTTVFGTAVDLFFYKDL